MVVHYFTSSFFMISLLNAYNNTAGEVKKHLGAFRLEAGLDVGQLHLQLQRVWHLPRVLQQLLWSSSPWKHPGRHRPLWNLSHPKERYWQHHGNLEVHRVERCYLDWIWDRRQTVRFREHHQRSPSVVINARACYTCAPMELHSSMVRGDRGTEEDD